MAFSLQDLGNNIKRLRKSKPSKIKPGRPMLQRELANEAHIPASSLCNIENGKYKNPTWLMLSKIARALNCDISEFFVSNDQQLSASQIAIQEMIDMIIKERLEQILKERPIK